MNAALLSIGRRNSRTSGRQGRRDIAAIAQTQQDGHIPNRFAPVELLTIVLTLAAMCMSQTPELTGVLQRLSRTRRRAVVVDAVNAILAY
jgi:hypothetical protein